MSTDLFNNAFGDVDLELLDLILKGHFENRRKLLDAGCGEGRNLFYFLQNNFDIYAIDRERSSIELTKYIFQEFNISAVNERVSISDIEGLTFQNDSFDAVICSRVLHFSESRESFFKQWSELVRVLRSNGLLYFAMDSIIGFEKHVKQISESKWKFSDGSVRFPLSEELLTALDLESDFSKIQPIKTIRYGSYHAQTILSLVKK